LISVSFSRYFLNFSILKKGRAMSKKNLFFCFAVFLLVLTFCENRAITAHGWNLNPADIQSNPLKPSPEIIDLGKEVYDNFCLHCHGENATGITEEKEILATDPPNLKKRITMHSDGDAFWKIQHGKNDMPSFKEDLKDKEIWSVILYIKKL